MLLVLLCCHCRCLAIFFHTCSFSPIPRCWSSPSKRKLTGVCPLRNAHFRSQIRTLKRKTTLITCTLALSKRITHVRVPLSTFSLSLLFYSLPLFILPSASSLGIFSLILANGPKFDDIRNHPKQVQEITRKGVSGRFFFQCLNQEQKNISHR